MTLMQDEVAVVTGGAQGIGRAVALLFGREGARVVVADSGCEPDGSGGSREPADAVVAAIRDAGGQAVASYADVSTPEGARSAIAAATERFGRLDTLVCAAGLLGDRALLNLGAGEWARVLGTTLTGSLLCTQAAAAQMIHQKSGGRIVHTTSLAGLNGSHGQASTSVAGAGVYGLMRTAAIELQRHQIRVNAVAPVAKTRTTAHLPMFQNVDTLSPEHAAPAYLFFGSRLSADVTGKVLAIAGARVSVVALTEGRSSFDESPSGLWTASALADAFAALDR